MRKGAPVSASPSARCDNGCWTLLMDTCSRCAESAGTTRPLLADTRSETVRDIDESSWAPAPPAFLVKRDFSQNVGKFAGESMELDANEIILRATRAHFRWLRELRPEFHDCQGTYGNCQTSARAFQYRDRRSYPDEIKSKGRIKSSGSLEVVEILLKR